MAAGIDQLNSAADRLMVEVFDCEHCVRLGAFSKSPVNGRFYKFPPIVGKSREANVLFIGINPRRSKTNKELHEWLMESPENFGKLAGNELKDGRPYIAIDGEEEHYHCHMIVVEGVFGEGTEFEEVAAVTELYLCANESGSGLLDLGRSICAERHLRRVIEIVNPRVVIAVGQMVQTQLTEYFGDLFSSPIVFMVHPRHLNGATWEDKRRRMEPTIDGVRRILEQKGRCL